MFTHTCDLQSLQCNNQTDEEISHIREEHWQRYGLITAGSEWNQQPIVFDGGLMLTFYRYHKNIQTWWQILKLINHRNGETVTVTCCVLDHANTASCSCSKGLFLFTALACIMFFYVTELLFYNTDKVLQHPWYDTYSTNKILLRLSWTLALVKFHCVKLGLAFCSFKHIHKIKHGFSCHSLDTFWCF